MTDARVTRGKTQPGRLRLLDPQLAADLADLQSRTVGDDGGLHVVDVGLGARPDTTVELHRALRAVDPPVLTYGLDSDGARVRALDELGEPGVVGVIGGFETEFDTPIGLVRAANLLRQYPLGQVSESLAAMGAWLEGDGLLVEGTTDKEGTRGVFRTFARVGGALQPGALVFVFDVESGEGFAPRALTPYLPRGMGWHGHPGAAVEPLLVGWTAAFEAVRGGGASGGRELFVQSCRRLADGGRVRGSGEAEWAAGRLVVDATLDGEWFAHAGGLDWGQGG